MGGDDQAAGKPPRGFMLRQEIGPGARANVRLGTDLCRSPFVSGRPTAAVD